METLLFLLDSAGVALAIYMSLLDDRRKVGETLTSWFRYRAEVAPGAESDPGGAGPGGAPPSSDARQRKLQRLQRKYAR